MNYKEEQIVTAVNQKNAEHWKLFYDRYYAALCSFVANIIKQQEDVEDLVQDVYIAIWESDRLFTDIKELTNYLYRACYNNALLYIRNNQLHNTILDLLRQNDSEEDKEAEVIHALAVKEEMIQQLYNCIEELPTEQRRIILLRIKGHSWEDIANILGVSMNTIKTQRSRSFKFLRKEMGDSAYCVLLLLLLG